jgi:hypothetical protein
VDVAIVCSAHGFGHTGRQLALAEALIAGGDAVTMFTAVPPPFCTDDVAGVRVVPWSVDVGIHQRDSRTEDPEATVPLVLARVADAAVDALADAVRRFDVAVVDIAPVALEACRRAGVPALAVGNFDWPWIYDHYAPLRRFVAPWRAWQAPHAAWSLWPGPGLSHFREVTPAGLLGRRRTPERVSDRAVLVSFGGFGLDGLDALLPRVDGVTWLLTPPMPPLQRPDVRIVSHVHYTALVGGADAVLTKPGYGIFAECARAGTPILWLDRGAFPEAPWLEAAMRARGDVKVGSAGIAAALAARWAESRPPPVEEDVAAALATHLRRGDLAAPPARVSR